MKTPITYYGGKVNMLRHILPLIPKVDHIYVEPFFGGGAVYFGKEPASVEVINDKLDMAITFYRVLKCNYNALRERLQATLHAERHYKETRKILEEPEKHDEVTRAWAFWVQSQLTFAHIVGGGFAFAKDPIARTTARRIDNFTQELSDRLRTAQIFCRDAIDVIKRFDGANTFFYLDPPYPTSDCGHYKDGKDVFYDLLKLLPELQGNWLLSSYPDAQIDKLRKMPGVRSKDIKKSLAVSGKGNAGKTKVECLTWNYQEPQT